MTRDEIHRQIKSSEGSRIQAVLGSVGALPAGALVFGESATMIAPGAPFYCAAVFFTVGAYLQWLYLDATFHMADDNGVAEKSDPQRKWLNRLFRSSGYHQTMTYVYGVLSLLATLGGAAGVYGGIRTGITLPWGFAGALAVLVVVFADVFHSNLRRNEMVDTDPF